MDEAFPDGFTIFVVVFLSIGLFFLILREAAYVYVAYLRVVANTHPLRENESRVGSIEGGQGGHA